MYVLHYAAHSPVLFGVFIEFMYQTGAISFKLKKKFIWIEDEKLCSYKTLTIKNLS